MAKKKGGRPKKATERRVTEKVAPATGESAGPSAAETKRQAAEARRQARRRADKRKRVLQNVAITGVLLALVALLLYWIVGGWYRERSMLNDVAAGVCNVDSRTDPGTTGEHRESVSYEVNPPSAGAHLPSASRAGDYSQAATPPTDGLIVHSHEHGYVTLWYRPDAGDAVLPALREIYNRHRGDVLIVPRPSLPTPVAATSWSKRLLCDSVDAAALEKFTDFYIGKGPEKVPRG